MKSFTKFAKSVAFVPAVLLAAPDLVASLPEPRSGDGRRVIYQNEGEARAALVKQGENLFHRTEAEFRRAEAAQRRAMECVSVDDIRAFLARRETLADVLNSFGLPFTSSLRENDGVLFYVLPSNRTLVFWLKGDEIESARYDREDMKGVAPACHKMNVWANLTVSTENSRATSRPRFKVDDEIFTTYAEFQKRIAAFPRGAVVEWQLSCVSFGGEPLSTAEEQESFKEFCRKTGLRLIIRPAG